MFPIWWYLQQLQSYVNHYAWIAQEVALDFVDLEKVCRYVAKSKMYNFHVK